MKVTLWDANHQEYTHTELKSAIKVMLEVGTLKGDSEVGV